MPTMAKPPAPRLSLTVTPLCLLTIGLLHASFNTTAALIDPAYDWIRLGLTVLLGVAAVSVPARVRGARSRPAGRA